MRSETLPLVSAAEEQREDPRNHVVEMMRASLRSMKAAAAAQEIDLQLEMIVRAEFPRLAAAGTTGAPCSDADDPTLLPDMVSALNEILSYRRLGRENAQRFESLKGRALASMERERAARRKAGAK
jgi:hypothetical protein